MILTDTHTHLYSEQFDDDREAMIKRALEAGVERFFIPAIDSTYTKGMIELKQLYPDHVFLLLLCPYLVYGNRKAKCKCRSVSGCALNMDRAIVQCHDIS